MTESVKKQIRDMRGRGMSFGQIATSLALPTSTIKSYCRREGVVSVKTAIPEGMGMCMCCGAKIVQNPKRKEKRFCSDKCRMAWWNNNLDKVNKKAFYQYTCACCNKPFTVYGNSTRKYCSHECYIKDRFGGGVDE
ncbi:RNA polymerase subunit sigma-70 [Butyrivibrio sp. CB08]|uniref:RNA polymerase subunit sigma-70 n=1 Tax=Butyrivibrio sp. CB08 TaxID=2364879 RepID=UPI000EAA4899|nr:RNA polymerase subunit sigma-70 [Butyrivibrio sp. CB08]RKM55398.1 RNA polymerase subunit sigma-70 [Butyrivibrio sp. CB08]